MDWYTRAVALCLAAIFLVGLVVIFCHMWFLSWILGVTT